MPNVGLSELIVILMILLLVFGASRLPQIGENLGRTVRGFKRGASTDPQIEVAGDAKPHTGAPALKAPAASTAEPDISDAEVVDKES